MNITDYLINSVLVLLVLRQIRPTRLTVQSLALPVVLVAAAGLYYVHSVPTAGNDVALDLALAAIGGILGALCALATHLRRDTDGVPLVRAGWLAAILWVVGIGARMAFEYAASHGAAPAIARFSAAHHITSGQAWATALVLMALAEVTTRLAVIWLRGHQLPAAPLRPPASLPAPTGAGR
jgi:hypothetical protein